MRGTYGPDDDSQQGPEYADARPRADRSAVDRRSAVAWSDVADLEPTTDELERKRARTAPNSKDMQPRNRCQTCLKHESGKRARQLHRGKTADSAVQSKVSKDGRIQQKDSAQQQVKRKPHSADDTYSKAKFKIVGIATRVQCKREASRIRRSVASDRSENDTAKQVTMTRKKVIKAREEK